MQGISKSETIHHYRIIESSVYFFSPPIILYHPIPHPHVPTRSQTNISNSGFIGPHTYHCIEYGCHNYLPRRHPQRGIYHYWYD